MATVRRSDLNQLVTQSLSGNRDLRVAFARLKAARAIRDDVSDDAMPTITSRASANLGKGQVPGQTESRVNSERYDLGLTWLGKSTCSAASSVAWKLPMPTNKRLPPTCTSCR